MIRFLFPFLYYIFRIDFSEEHTHTHAQTLKKLTFFFVPHKPVKELHNNYLRLTVNYRFVRISRLMRRKK